MIAARSVTPSTFCAFCSTKIADMPSSRMMRCSASNSSSTRIGASPSSGSPGRMLRGVGDQGAAAPEHLLLATRELVAEIAAAFLKPRKQLVDARLGPWAGQGHGGEILLDGERFEDVALLWHPADAGKGALVRAQRRDVAAIEADTAGEEARHAHDRIDQGGLAHAVAAEQSERLALGERERDLVEHDRLAVACAQPLDGQEVRHRATLPDTPP